MKTRLLLALFVLGFTSRSLADKPKPESPPQFAGPKATGYLLPNGWHITPVGGFLQMLCISIPFDPWIFAADLHSDIFRIDEWCAKIFGEQEFQA